MDVDLPAASQLRASGSRPRAWTHIGTASLCRLPDDRGEASDRLEQAASTIDDRDRLDALEREIAGLETERGGLAHQVERLEQYPVSRDGDVSGRR